MISITRSYEISAGHHLPLHEGKCRFPHGHNYICEVSVSRDMLQTSGPASGMVMDFTDLDLWAKKCLDVVDHHNLNDLLPKEYMPPTAEHLAQWIWWYLNGTKDIDEVVLTRVRVYETRNSWVEVTL